MLTGKIKRMIDSIIQERSRGNSAIAEMMKAKLILKGINPNKFDSDSLDDPIIIEKVINIAKQFEVKNLEDIKVNIKSVFSNVDTEEEVVSDIKSQLNCYSVKVLIFFASSRYDQGRLSALLQEDFEGAIIFGCSTAGEIVSGELLQNSVVAMAFNSNIISDAKVEVIEHLKESVDIEPAFASFEGHFNMSSYSMDTSKYVGIILVDGVSMKEEKIMELIGDRTNVSFVGGSAGDDFKFSKTYVCANGKSYTNAAVLVMLKMSNDSEFSIIKTQSFRALDNILVANKVNEETREVIEFNNKPAIWAYAEAVGAASIEDAKSYFMTNPVGLYMGENDIFVRSPQQLIGTSMKFYCNILEGMEVRLLQSTDIIEDTKKAIKDKIKEFGSIHGIIDFDCTGRLLGLKKKNLVKQYGEIFRDIPTSGFSTYGEQYIGHLNQTATMVVFKAKSNC